MSKQSSVDWLIEQLTPAISLQQKHIDALHKQAKEIHAQEIMSAANLPREKRWYIATKYTNCGEQYYHETYGK
jgi:hypothetical protein